MRIAQYWLFFTASVIAMIESYQLTENLMVIAE